MRCRLWGKLPIEHGKCTSMVIEPLDEIFGLVHVDCSALLGFEVVADKKINLGNNQVSILVAAKLRN